MGNRFCCCVKQQGSDRPLEAAPKKSKQRKKLSLFGHKRSAKVAVSSESSSGTENNKDPSDLHSTTQSLSKDDHHVESLSPLVEDGIDESTKDSENVCRETETVNVELPVEEELCSHVTEGGIEQNAVEEISTSVEEDSIEHNVSEDTLTPVLQDDIDESNDDGESVKYEAEADNVEPQVEEEICSPVTEDSIEQSVSEHKLTPVVQENIEETIVSVAEVQTTSFSDKEIKTCDVKVDVNGSLVQSINETVKSNDNEKNISNDVNVFVTSAVKPVANVPGKCVGSTEPANKKIVEMERPIKDVKTHPPPPGSSDQEKLREAFLNLARALNLPTSSTAPQLLDAGIIRKTESAPAVMIDKKADTLEAVDCVTAVSTPNVVDDTISGSSSTESDHKNITNKKVSEFPVPPRKHVSPLKINSLKKQPRHMYAIPAVAKLDVDSRGEITFVQNEPTSPQAQMPWMTQAPRFNVAVPPLGARLLKRMGSIECMRQKKVIPQARNIERIKLEDNRFPGLRVGNLRKGQDKYSFKLPEEKNNGQSPSAVQHTHQRRGKSYDVSKH